MRARAMSLALFTTRVVAGAISSSFVSVREAATPTGAWLLFLPVALTAFLFVLFLVPETKGVSLEQMPDLFEKKRKGTSTAQASHA
ncbi:hypothetical protein T492DRAFT_877604 [Pavlovales sp. CCMP2436]|nr:hypothetical protein T492DRAFT_877604 [Pavlovales sp. CCMP2436]